MNSAMLVALFTLFLCVLPLQRGFAQESKMKDQTSQKTPFRIFNPDTMAKPAAGYSQVAEVNLQ